MEKWSTRYTAFPYRLLDDPVEFRKVKSHEHQMEVYM